MCFFPTLLHVFWYPPRLSGAVSCRFYVPRDLNIEDNYFEGALPDLRPTVDVEFADNCLDYCGSYSRQAACPTRCNAVAPLEPAQKQALLELFNATSGATWTDNDGWTNATSDPCNFDPNGKQNWDGVVCAAVGQSGKSNNYVVYVPTPARHPGLWSRVPVVV